MLAGKIGSAGDLNPGDWRRGNPRFQAENLSHNLEFVSLLSGLAHAHDMTPAQLALAWVLRRGHDIVPIPGTRHLRYLEENAQAAVLILPESLWSQLDQALASFQVAGERYQKEALRFIDRSE